MPDARTQRERWLDEHVGPPLYYCADCLRAVKVTPVDGAEPVIERPCGGACAGQIIAPRRSILHGDGGLNRADRARQCWRQIAAALTGRCV